jgi:hypothetical protein
MIFQRANVVNGAAGAHFIPIAKARGTHAPNLVESSGVGKTKKQAAQDAAAQALATLTADENSGGEQGMQR